MDVRIGVSHTPKEIEVDLGDGGDKESVQKEIADVLGGSSPILWLTDRRGRTVGVPAEKIAYVEIGVEKSEHRVGFIG